jgi:hypothetical protein
LYTLAAALSLLLLLADAFVLQPSAALTVATTAASLVFQVSVCGSTQLLLMLSMTESVTAYEWYQKTDRVSVALDVE